MNIRVIPRGIVKRRILYWKRIISEHNIRSSKFDRLDSHAKTIYGYPRIYDFPGLPISARMFFKVQVICCEMPILKHGLRIVYEGPPKEGEVCDLLTDRKEGVLCDEEIDQLFMNHYNYRRERMNEPFFTHPSNIPCFNNTTIRNRYYDFSDYEVNNRTNDRENTNN